jgi:subtilisin family serine protease
MHGCTLALVTMITLLTAAPAAASTLPVKARTASVVQHEDGRLEVITGKRSAALAGAQVLAAGADPMLEPAGLLDAVDAVTGRVDDLLRAQQWHLDALGAESAWSSATGGGQVVAVVDTGVDTTHPDLRDRVVTGWSATGVPATTDPVGHGTHVAGIVAARAGDGFGVAGFAPDAAIMPIQAADATGAIYASAVASGVLWAVDNGADVINLSLAGTQASAVLDVAIAHAVAAGVPVVVAAGNEHEDGNPRMYPASHPDVIAVGALDAEGRRASFSSTGADLDLVAPGKAVLSTRPGAQHSFASGTSMAAPLVAAAVAALQEVQPDLSPAAVREVLEGSAVDLGRRGRDDEHGHGALDLRAALTALGAAPVVPEPVEEAPVEAPTPPAPSGGALQTVTPVTPPVAHYGRG